MTGSARGPLQLGAISSCAQLICAWGELGYNRGVKEKDFVGSEQSTPAEAEVEVYEGLKSAGLNDIQAFRIAQAVRVQAGDNISKTLEVHRKQVDARIDGVETTLTANIDRVVARLDRFETDLGAKIDGVAAKLDSVKTELKAETAKVCTGLLAEMKAVRKELSFHRFAFIVLIALVSLLLVLVSFLVASSLIPVYKRLLWQDSTPAQSVQAPVESNPPQAAVAPESDPPEPSPQ